MKNLPTSQSLLICLFLLFANLAASQYQIGLVPRKSPDRGVSGVVGYTQVDVTYGSPATRGRAIWGELVAYNKVWRAGANKATTVEFSTDVVIGGETLLKGKYSFFVLPKDENEKWTVIFNKIHKQWGAFKYEESEDALRFDVEPNEEIEFTEFLKYGILQTDNQHGFISLTWGELSIKVPFETNYYETFKKEVETRAGKQPESIRWIVYLQGAEHLEEIEHDLPTAKNWIDKSEETMLEQSDAEWNEGFYPRAYVEGHVYWVKAKLLASSFEFEKALKYVEKMKKMKDPQFYKKENDSEGIDYKCFLWEMNEPE